MAPSTEHLDQLLEWHPGAGDAATANVAQAMARGARRASRAKLLIVLLWLAYVVLALEGGSALLGVLHSSLSPTQALSLVVDSATRPSIVGRPISGALFNVVFVQSVSRELWSPSAYFLLFYALFAGGAVSYVFSPRPAPLLAQLGAASGAYAGRFSRLLLIAAGAFFALRWLADVPARWGFAEVAPDLQLVVLLAALLILAAIVDYARVRTVARDSRSMLLETARSARFFVRNLPRTLALEALILLLVALATSLSLALAASMRLAMSPPAADFIATQALTVALLWIRLAAWGAMLALYQGITLQRLARRSPAAPQVTD
jgi:hypothetical protein